MLYAMLVLCSLFQRKLLPLELSIMTAKERENFYRICTMLLDHGKESLETLLNNDLINQNMTFEDFLRNNEHEIYHLCYNTKMCCQCSPGMNFSIFPNTRALYQY